MRMQHWSKWIMALLVNLAFVASAQAQSGPVNGSGDEAVYQAALAGAPSESASHVAPEMYSGYSNNYGAYPVQPWPGVSPYDYSVDQTYYDNGLWHRHRNRRQTRKYLGVDFFAATLKRPKSGQPGGVVGSSRVNTTSAYDFTAREMIGQPLHLPDKDITAPFSTETFGSDETRPGLRIRLGAVNADDSSWEVTGFYAAGDEQTYSFTQGSLNRTPDLTASVGEGPFDRFFYEDGGDLVLVAASIFPDLGRLPFDEGVEMTFDSRAWGGEVNYYTTPIRSGGHVGRFHGSLGVRYLGIWENFGFEGSDSGYSENVNVVDPDGRMFQISPFTTIVDSRLISNLVGPQLGLKWEIGGEKLKLTTEVKGAVAMNFEQRELRVTGYGLTPTAQSELRRGDRTDVSRKEVHVGVSPIFEVSFMAEVPVMRYLPIANKLPVFRDGQFRIGYSFTQAWRIARAAQSVDYTAPLPRITTDRDTWHIGGLIAGFTWVH